MKWLLAWIGLVLSSLLLGGWVLSTYLDGFTLIGDTPRGRGLIAQDQALLLALWPLLVIGALVSAIPAWLFITGMFFRLHAEAQQAAQAQQDAVLDARPNAEYGTIVALQQTDERDHARWRALEARERAVAHAEQQAAQAQQEAARQVEMAQARIRRAEARAQHTTNAFQRVQRKLKRLEQKPIADSPSNAP